MKASNFIEDLQLRAQPAFASATDADWWRVQRYLLECVNFHPASESRVFADLQRCLALAWSVDDAARSRSLSFRAAAVAQAVLQAPNRG